MWNKRFVPVDLYFEILQFIHEIIILLHLELKGGLVFQHVDDWLRCFGWVLPGSLHWAGSRWHFFVGLFLQLHFLKIIRQPLRILFKKSVGILGHQAVIARILITPEAIAHLVHLGYEMDSVGPLCRLLRSEQIFVSLLVRDLLEFLAFVLINNSLVEQAAVVAEYSSVDLGQCPLLRQPELPDQGEVSLMLQCREVRIRLPHVKAHVEAIFFRDL